MDDVIFVADIGTTKVSCLAASTDEEGHIQVDAIANVRSRGLKRGVVHDMDEAAAALSEAADRVETELGRRIPGLAINISGSHLASVNAQGFVPISPQGRPIRREDILQVINHSRQMMMPPDREQIMAIPREFRLDGQRGVSKPLGMSGSRIEVVTHIITGQSTHVQNLERVVQMTGRRVELMVVGPIASGLGVLSPDAMEIGVVVVDIGGGKTDVAIFYGGAITYTATIPIGGDHVTHDIATLLKARPEEAERVKVEHGCALASMIGNDDIVSIQQLDSMEDRPMQRRVLCEIIECRMREIAQFVQSHIEKSGLSGLLPAGAVLTGGGSLLYGTEGLMSDSLRHIKARVAQPKVVGRQSRAISNPALACAVGLAKFSLEGDDHEFAPVSGAASWKDRIRTLKSLFGGKS